MLLKTLSESSSLDDALNLVARHADIPCDWNGTQIAHTESHEIKLTVVDSFPRWRNCLCPVER